MKLLEKVSFNKKLDSLWVTGDLVNRGSKSLEVMRFISSLGSSARVVLGNHDLNLIATYANIKCKNFKNDIILKILESKDIDFLIYWLRKQPFLQIDKIRKIIMVHAGIHPFWNVKLSINYSQKLQYVLCGHNYTKFLKSILNSSVVRYSDDFSDELELLKFNLNVFTKMRYCYCDGTLDMKHKQSPSKDTFPMLPWFSINNESLKDYFLFFGHWASLKHNITPKNVISLDTGCCWGGTLSMFRFEDQRWFRQNSEMSVN